MAFSPLCLSSLLLWLTPPEAFIFCCLGECVAGGGVSMGCALSLCSTWVAGGGDGGLFWTMRVRYLLGCLLLQLASQERALFLLGTGVFLFS